jgi:undecaprenyl-diphosphatase
VDDSDQITFATALKIGLGQCISMIPGVSRSGATIVTGMSQGLTRKAAAEFSFFLAVPTMFGATAKKLYEFYKINGLPSASEWQLLLIGNVVAFVVAMLAIRFFIGYLTQKGFRIFGWYRIVVGLLLLLLWWSGRDLAIL